MCASGTPNAGGGACSRSVTVSGTKRPASGERVHGHDAAADELLDEAEVAARLCERVGGRGSERIAVAREADTALAGAVRGFDHDRVAELLGRACHLGERAADDRARLRNARLGEPLALLLPRDGDLRRLRASTDAAAPSR